MLALRLGGLALTDKVAPPQVAVQRTTDKLIHKECGARAMRSAAHLPFQVKPVNNKTVVLVHLGTCVGVPFRENSYIRFCAHAVVRVYALCACECVCVYM